MEIKKRGEKLGKNLADRIIRMKIGSSIMEIGQVIREILANYKLADVLNGK